MQFSGGKKGDEMTDSNKPQGESVLAVAEPPSDPVDCKVHAWLCENIGPVLRLDRHARWRPGWDATVLKDGVELPLYVRGPRGDTYVSPVDMVQEAEIHRVFEAHGILAPHVYGMIPDPLSIVMEMLPGKIDTSTIKDDQMRRSVRRSFIEIVAKVHEIPVEEFADTKLPVPETPRDIALNLYAPSEAIFRDRIGGRDWPLMEFAWAWLLRNVPDHCARPSFVNYDGGQFLFDETGKVTGLIDFEVSSFGDPVAELSGMRLRDTSEPLGDLTELIAYYEELTGAKIPNRVIEFHSAGFCAVNGFLMWPLMFDSAPEQDYVAYMNYCVATSRWMIRAMADHDGVVLKDPPAPKANQLGFAQAGRHLIRHLSMMPSGTPAEDYARDSAVAQTTYMARQAEFGLDVLAANLLDIEEITGERLDTWDAALAALSRYVASADRQSDAALILLFHRWLQRQAFLLEGCGPAAFLPAKDLQPIRQR